MSEAIEAKEAEAADLTPEAGATDGQQTAEHDASGDAEANAEAEALAMGWKPKDQYKGPDDKFVSAAEYVERGKTIMPFLRKELVRRDREIEGLKKAVATSIQHISRADQRAYAKAKADLEAELAQYAKAGDAESVKAVTDDLIALEKDALAKPAASADDTPPEFKVWLEENPWYGKDAALSAACDAIGQQVFDEGYIGKAQIKEVDARLRAEFPHKFAKPVNPNRQAAMAVEVGGSAPRKSGKSFADLPAEAKQMCDEFCRDIKGFTREKFLKDYQW